jgi:hypothetical protein
MNNNEALETLVKIVQNLTGFTAKEISKHMGYNSGYLSQRLSNGDASKKFIDKMKLTFKEELIRYGYDKAGVDTDNTLNEDAPKYGTRRQPADFKLTLNKSIAQIYESVQRQETKQVVIGNFIAEIYAKVYDRPSAAVLAEMEALEKKLALMRHQ